MWVARGSERSRMRSLFLAVGTILLLAVAGCKRGPTDDEQQTQQKIRELEAKLDEAEQQEAPPPALLERSETPDLSLDLIAADKLLEVANEAVDAKEAKAAGPALARAGECLGAAFYSLPRKQMAARLERAITLLDGAELNPASRELELARRADFEADPPLLGPNVEPQLLAIRTKIEQGDPGGARQDILSLLDGLRKDEIADLFAKAMASVEAAEGALQREGYTAAQGEIAEARKCIKDLKENLKPAPSGSQESTRSGTAAPAAAPAQPEAGATEAAPSATEKEAPGAESTPTETEKASPAATGTAGE